MQRDHNAYNSGETRARVRNVPIEVESRDTLPDSTVSDVRSTSNRHSRVGESARYRSTTNHPRPQETAPRTNYQHQNSELDRQHCNNVRNSIPSRRCDIHDLPNQNDKSDNTSSIDIRYQPDSNYANQVNTGQSSSQATRSNQQSRGFPQHPADGHEYIQTHLAPETSRPRLSDSYADKENAIHRDTGATSSPDFIEQEGRPKTPAIIPLPPPPLDQDTKESRVQSPNNQPYNTQQTSEKEEPDNKSTDHMRPKNETGAMRVINATKQEVNKLLQEIIGCNEVSTKSKEYLRLEELLTRCILRLDDIECGEIQDLRLQRKAVIELVDKCTDILQRKVQLNHDIQSLSSRSS